MLPDAAGSSAARRPSRRRIPLPRRSSLCAHDVGTTRAGRHCPVPWGESAGSVAMGRGPDAEPPDRVVKLRVSRRPLRNLTLAVAGAALFDADFGGAPQAWSTRLPCSTSSARVCRRTRCGDVTTHAQWVGVSLLGEGEFPPGGRSDGVSAVGRSRRADGLPLDACRCFARYARVDSATRARVIAAGFARSAPGNRGQVVAPRRRSRLARSPRGTGAGTVKCRRVVALAASLYAYRLVPGLLHALGWLRVSPRCGPWSGGRADSDTS